jgi:alpha-tubulin suppressor-like RCC1 family protein
VRRVGRRLYAGAVTAVVAVVVVLLLLAQASPSGADSSAGSLVSFGDNYYGQLGTTTNNRSSAANATPTAVTLPGQSGSVSQVAAGSDFSLAVTSTGQLYGFGDNQYGQLGSATNNVGNTPNPTPTLVTLPGESGTVTQVAAGTDHSLAVTSSGQLYAFGDNYHGQLGNSTSNGTSAANPTPTLVTLPGGSGTVTQVAAGDDVSLVVTSTGELFAFGANDYGQLGFGTNNGTNNANPSPTEVQLPGGSGSVTGVAAGDDFSLVATSSGELYSFGDNYYGQLGTATNDGINIANPSPTLVTLPGESGTVTQIAAGSGFSLVVTSSGQLFSFGTNDSGQLGIATNDGMGGVPDPTPTLVALPGESGTVTAVAAGDDYSLAVTSSGQLYAFGDGGEGQLGSATITGPDNATPTLVSLPVGSPAAAQVAAGVGQSLVIASGGSGSSGTATLTIDTAGSGTGSVYGSDDCAKPSSATPSCAETFNKGTVITLDDSTTGSTKFVGWESLPPVASCFGSGICTFTLTADTTVTGVFEPPQVLTTTVVGDGQDFVETSDYSLLLHRGLRCEKALNLNSKSCTISYSYGTEETLTAVPAAGSKFVGWSGACAGTGTCTVLMDRAQDVTAGFLNDVGIHVNAMEVTQGIQTTELPTRTSPADTELTYQGVPLSSNGGAVTKVKFAQDHATVVRVYVNTALPLDGEPVPIMRLYAFRDGQMLAPGPIIADRVPSATGFPVGPLGQVTAAQRYGQNGVYTFTLPWGWAEGTVNFTADTNSDPTEFFHDCGTTDCQDRGLDLDLIHFNPVTVARIAPVAILVSSPASSIRGVSRPIGPLGWNPIDPQPDPVWQTVQEVVPFPIEVPPYVDVVDGTQAAESCDKVSATATPFKALVYAARNTALAALVTAWADSSPPTPPGGSEFQNSNPSIYPFGLLQPISQTQSTCTAPGGTTALGYSGGVSNTGGQPGAPVLYGSSQPISMSTDDRPITGIAHEFHHGIGLPHAGELCGSGTAGTAQTVTGSTTSGSKVLTLSAAASGLAVGQPVAGPGWGPPAGSTTSPTVLIVAINGSQVTTDATATSTTRRSSAPTGYRATACSTASDWWASTTKPTHRTRSAGRRPPLRGSASRRFRRSTT